ncbi:MAG TPA: hypothetical protein VF219_19350, partial [Vicinamibacterales bacterium]
MMLGAIRKAISLGGDADTLVCITGGIAEAFYGGVPSAIASLTMSRLDDRILGILSKCSAWFLKPSTH